MPLTSVRDSSVRKPNLGKRRKLSRFSFACSQRARAAPATPAAAYSLWPQDRTMLPSFESVVAGRTDLASLLPDLVYCNNLGTSHPDPSYIARLGNCTSYYRTNPQFPGAARLCEWREGGQCRAGPHIFASRAPPARPMPSPPPSPPPMPRPPPGPPPAAYTFAELTVGRTILPTGVWCFMVCLGLRTTYTT